MDGFTDERFNDYITCPYNAEHRVHRSLIAQHVEKCSSLNSEIIACPYNNCHRYPKAEMDNHLKVCASKPIPKDLAADFERDCSISRKDAHGNEIPVTPPHVKHLPGEIAIAGTLVYPFRRGANPRSPYRSRPSTSAPRSFMPPMPRMSLVGDNFLREIVELRHEPLPPLDELERSDEPN